ncbi:MAG TPA: GrpB family protein [Ktedonobacterales bacterium]
MKEPDVRVVIVDYDLSWPRLFQEEQARLVNALDVLACDVLHIGSTSVAGLPGKPIIDILLVVDRLGSADPYLVPLEEQGYTFYPLVSNPERLMFGKGHPHTHHLHIVERGGEEHIRPLLFRDYLRTHPETARDYAMLKRGLAARFHDNRAAYTAGKTDFILGIEAIARAGEDGASRV